MGFSTNKLPNDDIMFVVLCQYFLLMFLSCYALLLILCYLIVIDTVITFYYIRTKVKAPRCAGPETVVC